jgi:DNA mismatch endonuclease (patch repair protein)
MADVVTPAVRSRMMAGIRGRNTQPEVLVRRMLFAAGFRFRLHRRDLPGVPDIVLPKHQLAIFVHGCFWHQHEGCPLAKMPASNRGFWAEKLGRNQERDRQNIERLIASGWRVLVVWECATRVPELTIALDKSLVAAVRRGPGYAELPPHGHQAGSICETSRGVR